MVAGSSGKPASGLGRPGMVKEKPAQNKQIAIIGKVVSRRFLRPKVSIV
jgi:hypothetical protein